MPAVGITSPFSVQILDASDERESIKDLYLDELTDTNYDDVVADRDAFLAALEDVLRGKIVKTKFGTEEVISNVPPTDKEAQVETQMLVSVRDAATQEPFSFRLPAVNYSAFNYGTGDAGDEVIISGAGATAATLAFVAAVNSSLRSKFNPANFVTVTGMRIVK